MVLQSNMFEKMNIMEYTWGEEDISEMGSNSPDHVNLVSRAFSLSFTSLQSLSLLFQAINESWSSLWSPKRRVSNSSPPISSSTIAASCSRKYDGRKCVSDLLAQGLIGLVGRVWCASLKIPLQTPLGRFVSVFSLDSAVFAHPDILALTTAKLNFLDKLLVIISKKS